MLGWESTRLVSERPISSSDAPRPEFGLFDARLAQHLSKCQSQLVGHRCWFLSSGLDNRDENHPMAVRVNCLWIYTRPGTLPLVAGSQRGDETARKVCIQVR